MVNIEITGHTPEIRRADIPPFTLFVDQDGDVCMMLDKIPNRFTTLVFFTTGPDDTVEPIPVMVLTRGNGNALRSDDPCTLFTGTVVLRNV